MSSVAVFISDLHLGTVKSLRDFDSYDEFEDFLRTLDKRFEKRELDLVLLGDVFDLWQVVPSSDLPRYQGILPRWDLGKIQLPLNTGGEAAKLEEAVKGNSRIFDAMAWFLAGVPQRRVFFIPGNHDHSIIDSQVHGSLKARLTGAGVREDQVFFGRTYYENTHLQVYAEHGNQFDPENRYAEFNKLPVGDMTYRKECKGYFFVRLFWNLLESLEPSIDNSPSRWYEVFSWLFGNHVFSLIPVATRLYYDYRKYPGEFERVTLGDQIKGMVLERADAGTGVPTFVPERLYEPGFDPERIFSDDPRVEDFYRRLYHAEGREGEAARQLFDRLIEEKRGDKGLESSIRVPRPGGEHASLDEAVNRVLTTATPGVDATDSGDVLEKAGLFGREDRYVKAARGLFEPGNTSCMKGVTLDASDVRYVVFGHTHDKLRENLSDGVTYFNTGTWQTRQVGNGKPTRKLTYLILSKEDGNAIDVEFEEFGSPA